MKGPTFSSPFPTEDQEAWCNEDQGCWSISFRGNWQTFSSEHLVIGAMAFYDTFIIPTVTSEVSRRIQRKLGPLETQTLQRTLLTQWNPIWWCHWKQAVSQSNLTPRKKEDIYKDFINPQIVPTCSQFSPFCLLHTPITNNKQSKWEEGEIPLLCLKHRADIPQSIISMLLKISRHHILHIREAGFLQEGLKTVGKKNCWWQEDCEEF